MEKKIRKMSSLVLAVLVLNTPITTTQSLFAFILQSGRHVF